MQFMFWFCIGGVFFAYFGYPLTLVLLRGLRRLEGARDYTTVPVTLIITAFNEERRIREKMANSLVLEYPREQLQILVASDGSTDATNAIVRSYAERGVPEMLKI